MSNHLSKLLRESPHKVNPIADDLLRSVRLNKSFHLWMGFLTLLLMACLGAYWMQFQKGLIVTGLRDFVSWGMYISNFIFFVASSLIGMLISAVLGLIGYKWIRPITRMAEIIAIAFAAVAGLVIVADMGRPDRLPNVFLFGRVQSPILWDITVITTYLFISLLLFFIPLIPDLAIGKNRLGDRPVWIQKLYALLSFEWTHHPEQFKILFRTIRVLLILIVPTAFAIHTVTSWLLAVTLRPGWDSTIFGPYFLSGAFVAGSGVLIVAMYFFRKSYRLEKYITLHHFDQMGKLLFLTALVYFYFNINEFLVPAYKMKRADAHHLHTLFTGSYAVMFWITQLLGLVIPMILLLWKPLRKPLPLLIIALFVVIGSWLKRFLIVVPTMEHPYLPQSFYPKEWIVYQPTLIETAVTVGTLVMVLMIITVLSKLFPVVTIWEAVEDAHEQETNHKDLHS